MVNALARGFGKVFVLSLLTAYCLLSTAQWLVARADVPQLLNYQGRLTEADGAPLVGDHTVTFRIYDAQDQGSKLWEETHQIALAVDDTGIFSIVLGSLTPFATLDFNKPLWLSLEVDGEGEMAPRLRLAAVGYAINADTLDGLTSAQFLRADADTVATGELKAAKSGLALVVQPATDPAANTKLIDVRNAAGASQFSVDLEGDVSLAGSLPAHASQHQPGGADALPTASTASVGSVNSEGTSTSLSRADHVHQGLHSLSASGQPQLVGDVTLSAGTNVTLTQSGNDIQIASSAGAGQGNKVTAFASSTVGIEEDEDTDLLSVTITKSQASSALLILASVQLNHASGGNKQVDLKLLRGNTQLDATYRARIGSGSGQLRQLPVSLHFWDTSGAGTYTFTLKASADDDGAQATVRRLTVVELL